MYREHRDFHTPEDSTVVWHYFALPKFLGLIDSSALFFCKQDKFDDAGEGRLSQLDRRFLSEFPGNLVDYMEGDKLGCYYANCWTMFECDKYVLWKSYASLLDGVAVKSTVGRIKKALEGKNRRVGSFPEGDIPISRGSAGRLI